jgi:RNA polymerase primary sigma factor
VDVADLMQEGVLALLEALRRYDPGLGVPFWAYAAPWVHGAIYRLAQEHRCAIRLPAAATVELTQLRVAALRLAGGGSGEPSLQSVAREAGVAPERAELLLAAGRPPRSLQASAGTEVDGAALIDLVTDSRSEEPYEGVVDCGDRPPLPPLLRVLSGREREVIDRRFGLGCPSETLAEIGTGLGVTRERVRQIEARALAKLRAAAGAPEAARCAGRGGRAGNPGTRPAASGRRRPRAVP